MLLRDDFALKGHWGKICAIVVIAVIDYGIAKSNHEDQKESWYKENTNARNVVNDSDSDAETGKYSG